MAEREKIIDILNKNFTQEVECTPVYTTADGKEIDLPQGLCDIFNDIVTQAVIPYFADALIAAGIGDAVELKQELKAREGAANAYRIWFEEQTYRREFAEHRAEVAERALRNATEFADCNMCFNLNCKYYNGETLKHNAEECINWWLAQAEKELTEENADDKK